MRWRAAGAAGAALAALTATGPAFAADCTRPVARDPAIPTWEAVNAFALGARPATVEEIGRYVAALDHASGRVRAAVAGTSVQGRPLVYALVSHPANLTGRRLAALTRSLRARRPRGPAVVWIAGGAHGDEPSGPDADMRVLYDLAARTDCANLTRLRRLITVVMPLQNPDGRAAGTRDNAAGFDLNRDWFATTQSETTARLALIRRFPPVLLADQHEQDGADFTFPPNADPVHHEISRESLAAINSVAAPALRRAFAARAIPHTSGGPYDLFFMGYADTASTAMLGAGGMTFEQGRDTPFAEKVARQTLAADTMLDAAARHSARLIRGWSRHWRGALRQGDAGTLEPNMVLDPATPLRFPVPRGRVHAYALRADRAEADVLALVARLRAAGVVVRRLRAPWRARGFDPYGPARAGGASLPGGTFVVPMRQHAKHWVQTMLGEDAHVPFPYFYDVSAWSNPLLMGVGGGAVRTRVPLRLLRPVTPTELGGGLPARSGAAAYGFAGDSEGGLALAGALLARGVAVARVPGSGDLVATGADHPILSSLAAGRRVPLRVLAGPAPGAVALRLPKVAVLTGGESRSGAWSRHVVANRLGLALDAIGAREIGLGRLAGDGHTALIVPDGAGQDLATADLVALQAWVHAGGTLVGIRWAGIGVARAAGLTAASLRPPAPALRVPGALLRIVLDPNDPVAWGSGGEGFAFNDTDPALEAGSAHVVARHPSQGGFFVSGYAEGTEALHGSATVTHERAGAGHVVLFTFDPAFRGYAEGTHVLLANALLAPAGPPAGRRTRPVARALLASVPRHGRDSLVTVAASDEHRLLDAAADAGVPSTRSVRRDLTTSTLIVPPRALREPGAEVWPRRLLRALSESAVTPFYAAF